MSEYHHDTEIDPRAIAIIGLGGRFPSAPDIASFWRMLAEGREAVRQFGREELLEAGVPRAHLDHPSYVRSSAYLEGIEDFDAAFFGLTPREAEIMDPQHRLFLEVAWEALEDAGHDPDQSAALVGVFAGVGNNPYGWRLLDSDDPRAHALGSYQVILANNKDQLPTTVSYKLNLRGPSLAIQCACSSSLVAVHVACQSLIGYECDVALAGGVSISLLAKGGYLYERGGILSPDGHCRAFDAEAAGTVPGSGAGCVVLKRLGEALKDGDRIDAVILGSAINNDGAFKMGYTAPGIEGQVEVIASALAVADVPAESISLLEAHGTGTAVGDPVEVAALNQIFGEASDANVERGGFCALGSVKTNLGHLDTAAGVTGLIKATLALREKKIPPHLHFETPHPGCDLETSAFRVPTALETWPEGPFPRRAGVSSFGIGGTNAHVVLQEAPQRRPTPSSGPKTWVLSAPTATALASIEKRLIEHLEAQPNCDLGDVAATLHSGRKRFSHRRALVVENPASVRQRLEEGDGARSFRTESSMERPPVVFLFPGQGAQHPGMGMTLYDREPAFRHVFDEVADGFAPLLGQDLRLLLRREGEEAADLLRRTDLAQPTLFAVEYALAQLWRSWGIEPVALLGHSIGELVAACLAGVFDLEDALRLVVERGRLMQGLEAGAMLAVSCPRDELEAHLSGTGLDLAAINAPDLATVAGPREAISAFKARLKQDGLKQDGIEVRALHTAHAFHSAMTEPIVDAFAEVCRQVPLSPPSLPFVSGLTGQFITAEEATDPGYWAQQLRQPVRFADGCDLLLSETQNVFLEVGPGKTLSALLRRQPRAGERRAIASLGRPREARDQDLVQLKSAVARLWLEGAELDVLALAGDQRRRVSLPTYPFERQRYWIEAGTGRQPVQKPIPATPKPVSTVLPQLDDLEERIGAILRDLLGLSSIGRHEDFFELGGSSLLAIRLVARLEEALGRAPELETILAGTSLASLTAHLRQASAAPSKRLLTLRAEGEGTPFFWVHPIGGSVQPYRRLAALSQRPIHAFQAPGLSGDETPKQSISELARLNVDILCQRHAGPYLLGGWSFGGLVAFEMCRQLVEAGEDVEGLVLLDSWPTPDDLRIDPNEKTLLQGVLVDLVETIHGGQEKGAHQPTRRERDYRQFTEAEWAELDEPQLLDQLQIHLGLGEERLRQLLDLYRAHLDALLQYKPQPCAIPTLLVQANERGQAPALDTVFQAWDGLTLGHLEARVLPTTHHRLLIEPYVSTVVEWLDSFFAAEASPRAVVVPTAHPSPQDAAAQPRSASDFPERGIRHAT